MKYLIFLGSSLFIANPALAQDDRGPDVFIDNGVSRESAITVVATGYKLPLSQTGQMPRALEDLNAIGKRLVDVADAYGSH